MTSLRSLMTVALALAMGSSAAGGQARPASGIPALAREFVFTTLTFSPAGATQYGLHRYTHPRTGRVLLLDQMLDDFSPAELARQRTFYQGFRQRLQRLPVARLDPQTEADYELLQNAIAFAFYSLDEEQFYRWKPQLYPENLGSALFSNISLEYAPKNVRARDLAARLEKVPAFLSQATRNLNASNEIFRRVAIESVEGVRDLVKNMGADFVRGTPSASRYMKAQPAALAALDAYSRFVSQELPRRTQRDWRLGKEKFDSKFRYYLQVSGTPNDLRRVAEDSMRTTRQEMLRLAEPLHKQWFPSHSHTDVSGDAYLNAVVGEVMARIGAEHAHRDSLVQQGEKDVAMLQRFVRDKRILSLTDFSNLRVIPTPLFMRGIYGVAGAVFAPALEPALSTFYWVTPIPSDWTAERSESKMREYNNYKFLQLSIHEAVPGHAVQGEYANRVTPEWRRLLRVIYGNTPYIEGWAVYAEHMMEAAGANAGDPVKMRLNALKGMLRIYTNTIIDVRLHTMQMPGDSAVAMMMRDGFQERPEAEAKLQRAQLDYVQLMTYMAGVQEWTNLRRDVERTEGSRFNQCRYHDRVLLYGPVPVPTVRKLYMARVAPTAKAPPSRCGP
ncbi:MAG TPA: DUF885 domain-containing protein [Gemmatimonadaceae bacterium]|nr:DUF885 domain-containing protein [Gemmatimonadaceae bacterium]